MGRHAKKNRFPFWLLMLMIVVVFLFTISSIGFTESILAAVDRILGIENTQDNNNGEGDEEAKKPPEKTPDPTSDPDPTLDPDPTSDPDRIAYLTFDDGPSAITPKILDILRNYDVKATFFVIGVDTEFGRDMYRRIAQEGHAIGNHTYSHDYSQIYLSQEAFMEDFYKLEDLLWEVVGIRPKIMRFPGGSANHSSHDYAGPDFMEGMTDRIVEEGYQYFDWNVTSGDTAQTIVFQEEIINNVLAGIEGKDEAMILFHDLGTKKTTLKALPVIIEHLKEEGFAFRSVCKNTPGFRFH